MITKNANRTRRTRETNRTWRASRPTYNKEDIYNKDNK